MSSEPQTKPKKYAIPVPKKIKLPVTEKEYNIKQMSFVERMRANEEAEVNGKYSDVEFA